MIETICPHCGNKKSFEDSYAGRTFRCPICKEPVTIQNLVEMVQQDEESHVISFDDQLKKAEEEKYRKDIESQIEQLQAYIEVEKNKIKNRTIYLVICTGLTLACITAPFDVIMTAIGCFLLPAIVILISPIRNRNKALAEIENLKNQL
jgi:uncharacterized Zn finger protein (UPF0148 family)